MPPRRPPRWRRPDCSSSRAGPPSPTHRAGSARWTDPIRPRAVKSRPTLRLMFVGVLGPTVVTDPSADGRTVPLAAAKHRALIAALALHAGRPVSAEVLV